MHDISENIVKIYYDYMEYKGYDGNETLVYVFNNSYVPRFLKTSYANAI